jgi:hypothetical protein
MSLTLREAHIEASADPLDGRETAKAARQNRLFSYDQNRV